MVSDFEKNERKKYPTSETPLPDFRAVSEIVYSVYKMAISIIYVHPMEHAPLRIKKLRHVFMGGHGRFESGFNGAFV